ncbi:MAG TPA: class I SAM-dependent methyltransferase [Lichenihabitans sp.]|jgi:hypothetical protein|nr:class I SAM-dependent methyltransferase [Lichenihabitans sp.]
MIGTLRAALNVMRRAPRLATWPAVRRTGFFIPYENAPISRAGGYPALEPIFAAARPAFLDVIAAGAAYKADLERIARGGPGLVGERPARFGQEWFPRLDAVAAYTLVRGSRPRRIIEIGSGHSTRFLAQAIVDGGLATDLTCIDPRPRAPLAGLPLRHQARRFGAADEAAAASLGPGDILFIDSSHVAMPGTEVDRLLLDVLPRLGAGVLVHLHDIFLPDPYPAAWMRRGYNEQIVVGALLQGGAYDLVFASRYVATRTDLLAGSLIADLPLSAAAFEASLWLRKRSAR